MKRIQAEAPEGPFWRLNALPTITESPFRYFPTGFGYIPVDDGDPPDWHTNLLTGERFKCPDKPWHAIPDFGGGAGDIKGIWELSRFDWVLGFAREYRQGNTESYGRLESWLEDWVRSNPPYLGPNWKCGQEASIRVMHLAMAAIIMEQTEASEESLLKLIEVHLKRISPTIQYAIGQDNNHGTSEAAALFIGGSWLARNGFSRGYYWQNQGRKWLENRARRLIEPDGSFSQYSANYHRVMLDTFSMVEVWRRKMSLPRLSEHWYLKARVATDWLGGMLQPNGDVPNIGANDGARLLPLAATDYRDFRPSIQLASALFKNEKAVTEVGEWDMPLRLLSIAEPLVKTPAVMSQLFNHGGYAAIWDDRCFVLFRYPRFRFRPGHEDALHVDLWLNGENILRDGGTFSYNTIEPWQSYFPGVKAHNTIQFDHREPMPRVSRFLVGEWLKTSSFEPLQLATEGQRVAAGYRDYLGASHERRLNVTDGLLRIEDVITGFKDSAILRWRLQPGDWTFSGQAVTLRGVKIEVRADTPLRRVELIEGWESRYYGQKTQLPVLEVEVASSGRIVTDITWKTL
ncbi:heparinase II/III-family protein [Marinobacter sp. KMM 10035]|uniref:heparinase II/III family protein n=1 Tax=Marinobacter sp. KMM 10035 TaxID=3134034 RepID=UPI00397CD8B6